MVKTIKAALAVFKDKKQLDTLTGNAMKCNFSWETSAKAYIRLYEKVRSK